MSSIGEVVIEDGEEWFRLGSSEVEVGDVGSSVGVGGEEFDACATKGASTDSRYSSSAASATIKAASISVSNQVRMFGLVGSIGLPSTPTTDHASMPESRYASVSTASTSAADASGSSDFST